MLCDQTLNTQNVSILNSHKPLFTKEKTSSILIE